MIPKKIHYCWLSNEPFPESIQKCIESWKRVLADYELVLWNFDRFPRGKSKWVDQAFDNHRFAFAADYIRAYALFTEGGIYLDSDVEVLKPFDDLLSLPYFLGKESTEAGVEAATLGFEKGHPLIKALLDYYNHREFIQPDGSFDEQPMPFLFRKCIASTYQYHEIYNTSQFDPSNQVINILPVDWFSPKDWQSLKICTTERTYSIHHFAASWKANQTEKDSKLKQCIQRGKIKLRNACSRFLLINRSICFLTNSSLAFSFSNAFCLPYCSPLNKARMSQKDFSDLLNNCSSLKQDSLEFITLQESKYKETISTFYPIARIKNSDIEIHYNQCVSREEALNIWTNGIKKMDPKQILWLFGSSGSSIMIPEKFSKQGVIVKMEGKDLDMRHKTQYLLQLAVLANKMILR